MSRLDIGSDFLRFLRERKRYWLLPAAATLLLLSVVIALAEVSGVGPFIYTLF